MVLISLAFVSFISFISTLAGGLLALRFRKYTHLLLAFTAGVLIALWLFHLIPEIMELSDSTNYGLVGPVLAIAAGYIGFQLFHHFLHRHHTHGGKQQTIGVVSALALGSHSFLDGLAIGAAFQVNVHVGVIVAVAVIAHDFADGLNAVSVMLAYKNSTRRAAAILALVSLAPVAGVISAQFVQIPQIILFWYLAGFAGFIIYLLAKDILPQIMKKGRGLVSMALVFMGVVFIYGVTNLMHNLGV